MLRCVRARRTGRAARRRTLVRLNAAAQVAAGAALTFGVAAAAVGLVLIGSLVPTTAGGHRFWEFDAGAERNTQRNHFLKNISIVGGLLHVLTAATSTREHPDEPG